MKLDLNKPIRAREDGDPAAYVYAGSEGDHLFVLNAGMKDECSCWYSEDELDDFFENIPETEAYFVNIFRDFRGQHFLSPRMFHTEEEAEDFAKRSEKDLNINYIKTISFEVEND